MKKLLIDWLFEVGEKFLQSNLTIHIAIAYLERAFQKDFHLVENIKKAETKNDSSWSKFLKSTSILKDEGYLRLLALTCLLLAAKYDELDDKIPFINDLSHIYRNLTEIKHSDVIKLET
jgi:hypothetical protein